MMWDSLVICVSIRVQKTTRKAGVCASLSPFRIKEKNAIILVGKVFFINLLTRCDYWVISQIHHYFLISQNRFFDILRSFWHFSS